MQLQGEATPGRDGGGREEREGQINVGFIRRDAWRVS